MSVEKPTQDEILAKDKVIKAEKRRLKSLLEDLTENKKKAAEGLIDECAFMRATLKQYRDYITAEGLIDVMPQGDYSMKGSFYAQRRGTKYTQNMLRNGFWRYKTNTGSICRISAMMRGRRIIGWMK